MLSNHTKLAAQSLPISIILGLSLFITGCGGGGGGGSVKTASTDAAIIAPSSSSNSDYSFSSTDYNPTSAGLTITNSLNAVVTEPTPISSIPSINDTNRTYRQQTMTNASAFWDLGYRGQGVTIGIVDSGINASHPDFFDDAGNSRVNYNLARGVADNNSANNLTINRDFNDIDSSYHGTHVSSIAAGREYGVAPEATLLPVNIFFDDFSAYSTAVWAGINDASQNASIINASISNMVNFSVVGNENSEFNAYLTTLKNSDSVLVTAAGNGGTDFIGDPVGSEHFENFSSARNLSIQNTIEDQVLHVVALSNDNQISSFSNYPGSCSDVSVSADRACTNEVMTSIQNNFISAPGTSITAAYGGYNGSNNYAVTYQGTSMAAPAVSGGLALLLSSWDQLTPQQAVAILKESANDSGIYSNAAIYGVGLMDLQAAVQPLGDLKSAASIQTGSSLNSPSTTSNSSFTLGQSTSQLPSSLASLVELQALKSVAYFDKYNRDFEVDVTQFMQVEKQAIDWNSHWSNEILAKQSYQYDELSLSIGFNPNHSNIIQSVSLQNDKTLLHYQANSHKDFIENTFIENAHFVNLQDSAFGHSFTAAHKIYNNTSVVASFQDALDENSANITSNSNLDSNDGITNYSLGLNFDLTPNLSLLTASQISFQDSGFNSAEGNGVFAFGENSQTQQNILALNYKNAHNQIYGQFKQGQLNDIESSPGSYFDIDNAQYAQFKLGVIHQASKNQLWGLETFNNNTLISSDIRLSLPMDVDSNGNMQLHEETYSVKNSLQPDSLQFFYKSQLRNKFDVQLNYLSTPDDTGLGVRLNKQF